MFEKVKSMLAKQLDVDPSVITPETRIMEDLGADSLDIVEMFMIIEQEFNITVPDDKLADLRTVGGVSEYLEKNQK